MTQSPGTQQKTLKVNVRETEIAYEDVGSGPAVVLLHGYPFNRSLWKDQAEALRQNYRVITPDLRGHGASAVGPSPTTIELMAGDVLALLKHLNIDSATIGGLSMGGYVAFACYRLFAQRVRSLILAATRAQADTEEAKLNRTQQAEKALREGMEKIADDLLPKLLASNTAAKQPEVVKQLREMMANTKPEGAVAALQAMATREDQTSFLPNIKVPTLILVGDQDAIIPLADAELMHRGIGGSRLQVIAGAGHVLNLEKPDEFNEAIEKFLSELKS